jgi:hypothetical protein
MGAVLLALSAARGVGEGKADMDAISGDSSAESGLRDAKVEPADPRSGLRGAVLIEVSMDRSASERRAALDDPGPS